MKKRSIPVYGINKFKRTETLFEGFHVEEFDAQRHFEVQYPHRHDFFEILFLTRGSGNHVIDFKEYQIKPNSMFFLSPGQIHNIELSKDVEGFIFLFSSEFFLLNAKEANKLLEFPFFYHLGDQQHTLYLEIRSDVVFLKSLFMMVCQDIISTTVDTFDIVHSTLNLILFVSKKIYPKSESSIVAKKGHLLVKKFKVLIDEYYQSNFTVSTYAEMLNVTPSHLTEIVKGVTGRTSTDMINEKMNLEIKRLLLFTNNSVTEICESLNFKDQSYFSRYFKRLEGVSPLEFRKRNN